MSEDKIIKIQGSFLDLLNELEKISIDFVELPGLYDYVFMTNNNDFNYIIHHIDNNHEIYTFQYYQKDKSVHDIPNAVFRPEEMYDFEINLTKKTFHKVNQYTVVNFMDFLIDEEKKNDKKNEKNNEEKKKKNMFCGLF